jgi:hypothetical protein
MSLSALARQGDPSQVRDELVRQLTALKIDPTPALRGLGGESSQDPVEVVARLVSLARGHGYGVELQAGGRGQPAIRIATPAGIGTLQSGHHNLTDPKKRT